MTTTLETLRAIAAENSPSIGAPLPKVRWIGGAPKGLGGVTTYRGRFCGVEFDVTVSPGGARQDRGGAAFSQDYRAEIDFGGHSVSLSGGGGLAALRRELREFLFAYLDVAVD